MVDGMREELACTLSPQAVRSMRRVELPGAEHGGPSFGNADSAKTWRPQSQKVLLENDDNSVTDIARPISIAIWSRIYGRPRTGCCQSCTCMEEVGT